MTSTTRRTALGAIGASLVLACRADPSPAPAPNEERKAIDEHQARALALKHYRALTRGLHLSNPRSGELMPVPELTQDYFSTSNRKVTRGWFGRSRQRTGR